MKKFFAIAIVLMFLAVIMGNDWWGNATGGDRAPGSSRGGGGDSMAIKMSDPASAQSLGSGLAPTLEGEDLQVELDRSLAAVGTAVGDGQRLAGVDIGSGPTAFYFIRSSEIFDSGEPTERQRELLHAAMEAVLASLGTGTFLFDADVTSQFGSAVLVFAKEEYDLTRRVRSALVSLAGGGAASLGKRDGFQASEIAE